MTRTVILGLFLKTDRPRDIDRLIDYFGELDRSPGLVRDTHETRTAAYR